MGLYTSIHACEARFYHYQQLLSKINHLRHEQQYCGTELLFYTETVLLPRNHLLNWDSYGSVPPVYSCFLSSLLLIILIKDSDQTL